MDEALLRRQLCDAGKRLSDQRLIVACEGNLSARLGGRRFLITPRGRRKGELTPSDLLVCTIEGYVEGAGKPSTEAPMHRAIYRARPDCLAVVHAHPPFATAFGIAGRGIPSDLLPEAAMVLGPVALVPFGLTGTEELARAMEPYLLDHKAFLLANHGATTLGSRPEDALQRMETLEQLALMVFAAEQLGKPTSLPPQAVAALKDHLHGKLGSKLPQ